MTPDELAEMLRLHALWLANNPGGKRAELAYADLSGADLGEVDLTRAVLSGAVLSDAVLTRAVLSGAVLSGADLYYADLSYAVLSRANLAGANLTGANLTGAVLAGADLTYADLSGADLTDAILTGAQFADAILSEAKGIVWAQIGPIGLGPRTTTAVWQDGQVIHHAGCFTGTRSDYEANIDAGGWEWPDERQAELGSQCRAAIALCELGIHQWLKAIE